MTGIGEEAKFTEASTANVIRRTAVLNGQGGQGIWGPEESR